MVELCLTYFIVYTIVIVLVTIYLTVRYVCPTINSAREPVPVDKKVLQTAPRPSQFDENRWDASPKSLAKPQSPASYDVDSDSDTPDYRQRKPGSQRHNSRRLHHGAPDATKGTRAPRPHNSSLSSQSTRPDQWKSQNSGQSTRPEQWRSPGGPSGNQGGPGHQQLRLDNRARQPRKAPVDDEYSDTDGENNEDTGERETFQKSLQKKPSSEESGDSSREARVQNEEVEDEFFSSLD